MAYDPEQKMKVEVLVATGAFEGREVGEHVTLPKPEAMEQIDIGRAGRTRREGREPQRVVQVLPEKPEANPSPRRQGVTGAGDGTKSAKPTKSAKSKKSTK